MKGNISLEIGMLGWIFLRFYVIKEFVVWIFNLGFSICRGDYIECVF